MDHPFNAESPHREPLAELVTRVVDVETRIRTLQAERSTLLAHAHDLAEREGLDSVKRENSAVEDSADDALAQPGALARLAALPRGTITRRDRAHRIIRAELAAALHLSEWSIGHDITQAVELQDRCPALHAAQSRGKLDPRHVRGVIEAGRIIEHWATESAGSTLLDEHGQPLTPDAFDTEVARRHHLFEAAVLPYAQTLTPAQLVPVAKRLAEKVAGVTFDDRHARAARDRRVWVTDLEDGMSHLTAYLTSVEAHAIFDRLTQCGRRLQTDDVAASRAGADPGTESLGEIAILSPQPGTMSTSAASAAARDAAAEAIKRPLPEARADSLVSLLLEGEVTPDTSTKRRHGPRVSARVQVLVPVSLTGLLPRFIRRRVTPTLAPGTSASTGGTPPKVAGVNRPATGAPEAPTAFEPTSPPEVSPARFFQPELAGVGLIDTDTAARIAHDAPTWDIVIIDDGTGGIDTLGDILTVDGYRVPARLRRLLAARDQHCRFPGCTLPVFRCDIDHTIAAEHGGPTATNNLGHLCRGHHTLKHHSGIQVTQHDRGEFDWTFPTGRRYATTPPSKVTFSSAIGPPDLDAALAAHPRTQPYGPDLDAALAAHPRTQPYGPGFDDPPDPGDQPGDDFGTAPPPTCLATGPDATRLGGSWFDGTRSESTQLESVRPENIQSESTWINGTRPKDTEPE